MGFPIMVPVAVVVVAVLVALVVFTGRRGRADGRGWWNEDSLCFGGLLAVSFLAAGCVAALDLVFGLPSWVFPVVGLATGFVWAAFVPMLIERFLERRRGGW